MLQPWFEARLAAGGFAGEVICCSSCTLMRFAEILNCTCGALKLRTVRLPLASDWPRAAVRFCRIAEFCVNCRSAFRRFNGCVSDGVFKVAFRTLPFPLKFIAEAFFRGPVAWTFKVRTPLPLAPASAETHKP